MPEPDLPGDPGEPGGPGGPGDPGPPTWPQVERRQDGRSRLWQAFSKPTRGQAVVGVLLALVGFAVVTQVRTNQVDDTYAGLREQDLIDILDGLADTTQRAQSEVQRLEARRDELRTDAGARQAALDEARQQAQVLSVLAGTVPVRGTGVNIRIEEDEGRVEVGPFIDLIQALRNAGAEAIQINHEVRVIAQTSFEQADDDLLVDGRVLEPPFEVDAIGSPENLSSALRFPGGPQAQFRDDDDAELTYEESSAVDVETTREAAEADVARAQQ